MGEGGTMNMEDLEEQLEKMNLDELMEE
jgi:hypothetical protein